jgi:hypothetical protein
VADAGKVVASGRLPARTIPVDNGIALGPVRVDLTKVPAPARYKLAVALDAAGGDAIAPHAARLENDWDVWVYPPRVSTDPPRGVMVTDDLDEAALTALRAGGRVLLLIPPDRVKGDALGKVALGFSSIFWNTAWTHRQAPHTLGILCDPKHPALAHFPTDDHSNWQWWYLVSRAGAMILDGLPAALRPTVQVIDDWVTNRKLALVFEAKVAGGHLLVSSIDLSARLDGNPVARQMRHSLLGYAAGARFKPSVELTAEQVRGLMEPWTAR